jgi:hypothetical protein
MANVSPGVFTKIIDLSAFVAAVPSTIGFLSGLTRKGRDNELIFVGSRADFVNEWGDPNITDFGKNYGQGPYVGYNFLGESGSLYWIRCLPDNAAYSNLRIDTQLATVDATASISITFVDSLNSIAEIQTELAQDGDTKPLAILRPIGRGDYYNAIGIRLTQHSNPTLNDVYVLDVYEKQTDGDDIIIESFDISFDPLAQDLAGESIWITYVLEVFSAVLRADMELADGNYTSGYELTVKNFDKEIGTVEASTTGGSSWISDIKQDFEAWETTPETGNAAYVVIAKDAKGNQIWGWMGASSGVDNEIVAVYPDRNLTGGTTGWNGSSSFDPTSVITYLVKQSFIVEEGLLPGTECSSGIACAFLQSEPVPLRKGSEGTLRLPDGTLNTTDPGGAEELLEQAYSGLLTNPNTGEAEDQVLDIENIWFSVVYDAGYPADVKTAISNLCTTRRDCVGILDNGDNASVNAALATRTNTNTFNNYFVALYESFNKVSDPFTGQDIWFSPLYHMAYLLPRNDNVAEIWFAVAGFNRASIDSIKEIRYNPRLGQRDQLYLKQLNPIVKFAQGYVMWGQLTAQAKSSALSDLNIVRMVLFVKRAIEQFCRFFIFEQNDPVTWAQVSGGIVDFLEQVKKRRGLNDYTVEVSATEYERKTKRFHVNIILDPTRVVEQIELNFFIV